MVRIVVLALAGAVPLVSATCAHAQIGIDYYYGDVTQHYGETSWEGCCSFCCNSHIRNVDAFTFDTNSNTCMCKNYASSTLTAFDWTISATCNLYSDNSSVGLQQISLTDSNSAGALSTEVSSSDCSMPGLYIDEYQTRWTFKMNGRALELDGDNGDVLICEIKDGHTFYSPQIGATATYQSNCNVIQWTSGGTWTRIGLTDSKSAGARSAVSLPAANEVPAAVSTAGLTKVGNQLAKWTKQPLNCYPGAGAQGSPIGGSGDGYHCSGTDSPPSHVSGQDCVVVEPAPAGWACASAGWQYYVYSDCYTRDCGFHGSIRTYTWNHNLEENVTLV